MKEVFSNYLWAYLLNMAVYKEMGNNCKILNLKFNVCIKYLLLKEQPVFIFKILKCLFLTSFLVKQYSILSVLMNHLLLAQVGQFSLFI